MKREIIEALKIIGMCFAFVAFVMSIIAFIVLCSSGIYWLANHLPLPI